MLDLRAMNVGDSPEKFGGERRATCHPSEKHYCKGLCRRCYDRARMRRVRGTPDHYIGTTGRLNREGWLASIEKRLDKSTGCWVFTGQKNKGGYGTIRPRRGIFRPAYLVHRLMYELLVGDIPLGLGLDHLCRVRACCNPAHLEPVTHAENVRRGWAVRMKSECPRGHPYNDENTRYRKRGVWTERICRLCERIRAQLDYYRKAAA